MRTFLGLKNRPCPISMRTEPPKMGKHFDIKCGHGGRSVAMSDPYADINRGPTFAPKKTDDTAPGLSRLA